MKFIKIFIALFLCQNLALAQQLKLNKRKHNALSGTLFYHQISNPSLALADREELIFKEIKNGNIPKFNRNFTLITDTLTIDNQFHEIAYYCLNDYLAIGNDVDFIYIPTTPILAQKIANLTSTMLPTRKMVNQIYKAAKVKLYPQPIPPTKAMTTIPVFKAHTDSISKQLSFFPPVIQQDLKGGHKKDIIISAKIYGENTNRVVIYGWHQLNGKAIQPLYNKHINTWADYSHGIRLVQDKIWLNGKKTTLQKILNDPKLHVLLSDEGMIEKAFYPITGY